MSLLDTDGIKSVYIASGGADPHRHVVMLQNTETGALFDLTPIESLELMAWLKEKQEGLKEFVKAEEEGL